jgi:hypothetical protein
MNISFLYARLPKDVWNTSIALQREFEAAGHKTRCYSSMNLQEQYTEDGLKELLQEARRGDFIPNVIINFDYGMFKSPLLNKHQFPYAKWVLESGDDPQSFGYNFQKAFAGNFDAILSPDIRCCEDYNRRGFKCYWFPHFADTAMYPKEVYDIQPDLDAVCTRSKTDKFFQQVRERLGNRFDTTSGLHALEHSAYLRRGKIVLQNSQYKEITRRLFEGMLANRMVIADRPDKGTCIEQIFTEGKEIVYFDTLDDLIDKVNYYTNNEQERLKIAQAGFDKVSKLHTAAARVKSLLMIL